MNKKLETKKEFSLAMYFYIVQAGGSIPIPLHDFRVVLAYNENEALGIIRGQYLNGTILDIKKEGYLILDQIHEIVEKKGTKKTNTKKKTQEQFVNELLLVTDQFVKLKKDQEIIKNILTKIDYGV